MRFAFLIGLSPILFTASCHLPRDWKIGHYADSCAPLDERPPAQAQLFVTLRLPRCVEGSVTLTQFRAQQLWYAAQTENRIRLYQQKPWRDELRRRVQRAGKMPVLFIHGYNNSNAEALQRTNLIAWALKGRYPVLSLTWPSYAKKDSYFWDEANNEWAADGARQAVSEIVEAFPGTVIVAHSMGNRLALAAMAQLRSEGKSSKVARLIMAAPDVDRDITGRAFRAGIGADVTVYASLRDQPLSASWRAHGYPRAGDFSWWVTGRQPYYAFAWIPRVEVIDTTRVDNSALGHAAFIETPEGAADLCRVINGQGAKRSGLQHDPAEPANYGHLVKSPTKDDCTWTPLPRKQT